MTEGGSAGSQRSPSEDLRVIPYPVIPAQAGMTNRVAVGLFSSPLKLRHTRACRGACPRPERGYLAVICTAVASTARPAPNLDPASNDCACIIEVHSHSPLSPRSAGSLPQRRQGMSRSDRGGRQARAKYSGAFVVVLPDPLCRKPAPTPGRTTIDPEPPTIDHHRPKIVQNRPKSSRIDHPSAEFALYNSKFAPAPWKFVRSALNQTPQQGWLSSADTTVY